MLNTFDRNKLASLYGTDLFKVLQRLGSEIIAKNQESSSVGDTEFLYLKNCLIKDGKIQGISEFLREIENSFNNK